MTSWRETWQPHGLIRDRDLEEAYQNAKKDIDSKGNSTDPKEFFTVHLWEDFLPYYFPRPNFKLNSQQPPSGRKKGADKQCDLAIKYIDDQFSWHILIFAECKRAKNTSKSKIRDLETQAQSYCEEFLKENDAAMVFAMTLVGPYVRCWSFRDGDDKLMGLENGNSKDHFEFYRDIGQEENRLELEKQFAQIKSMPVGALRRGQDPFQIGHYGDRSMFNPVTNQASQPEQSFSSYPMPLAQTTTYAIRPGLYSSSTAQGVNHGEPSSSVGYDNLSVPNQPQYPTSAALSTPESSSELRPEHYRSVVLVRPGRDIPSNLYRFQATEDQDLEKCGSEFFAVKDAQGQECWVYEGRTSKIRYWTWSLDPKSGYVDIGKGKGKESGKRKY